MNFRLIFAVIISIGSLIVVAHPVSFKDAVSLMSFNSAKMNELLLTYSFSHRLAVGTMFLRDSDSEFYIPRANYLVKRWNETDSQANLYLSAGSGLEKYDTESYSAHFGEIVLDWESRKYYTYLDHLYIRRENDANPLIPLQDYNHTKLRLGFAPFLADYEDLNVWYIAQFEKHNDEKQINMTQFLRFYQKNVLWEVGAGLDGSLAFNFMIHL